MEKILAGLEEKGVFWRWIKVDYASHSPQVISPELLKAAEGFGPVFAGADLLDRHGQAGDACGTSTPPTG